MSEFDHNSKEASIGAMKSLSLNQDCLMLNQQIHESSEHFEVLNRALKRVSSKTLNADENQANISKDNKPMTTKHTDFVPYEELGKDHMKEHLGKTTLNLFHRFENASMASGFSSPFKVEKTQDDWSSTTIDSTMTVDQFISVYVLPKWKSYMSSKTIRKEESVRFKARNDTLWKKVIRDVREFFRIYFRMRFDNTSLKTVKSALEAMKITFEELGIPLTENEAIDKSLFSFVHQAQKQTIARLFKRVDQSICKDSPFGLLKNYNELKFVKFVEHKLASRMLYFVLSNYLEEYVPLISKNYRERLTIQICCMLKCYKKMRSREDISRIKFWVR